MVSFGEPSMLHEFVTTYRTEIIARAREKLTARPWPSVSAEELDHGVPLFLDQLSEVLLTEQNGGAYSPGAIGSGATRHGRDLLTLGFTVSQVVHDYGDICQAVTELAVEQNAPITTEEFRTLNRCLDTAIAEAVTEHARLTAQGRYADDAERSAHIAHETRDLLNTAMLAFETLKRGTVAINGSTGAVLGRSLVSLRDLVSSTISDIKIAADQQRRDRVSVTAFIDDLVDAARLHAEFRDLSFTAERAEVGLAINADRDLLASAVTNLLNNAFKFTRPGGRVTLRTYREHNDLVIEVQDSCGGLSPAAGDLFKPSNDKRKQDRTGLGLGLSIARKIARAHGGDISVRDLPGRGCSFSIRIPLAAEEVPAPPAIV
jgi:signal transduction histidine kinase